MVKKVTRRLRLWAGLPCSVSAAAVIALGAPAAFAQTSGAGAQAATPTAAQEIPLTEVVVTAERRSETVQTATQSITAISGPELQASGVVSLEQIADEVPGMSEKNNGPGQTEYEMRGMSSSGGSSPTVGFYFNDVPMTPPMGSDVDKPAVDPNLYDLNRIEVLRGPQGTLYGASSMGGTIRVITNEPNTHEFGASVQVIGSGTEGGGANGGVSGMINIPLVDDKLALRLVGTDSYTSGWIDRIYLADFPLPTNGGLTRGDVLAATPTAVHKDANWERTDSFRASLLWTPTDNLTVSPTVQYQKLNQGGQNQADVPPGVNYEAHYQPQNVAEPSSDEFELFTLPIKYTVGDVQFDSITGYYHRINSLTQDNAEDGVYAFGVTFAQLGPLTVNNLSDDSQYTQEFRISSTGDGPFQWLAGAYYQNFDSNFKIQTNQANAYSANAFGESDWYYGSATQKLTQYAGFGEASYKVGDFKLTTGLRYYSYDTSFQSYQYGIFAGSAPGLPSDVTVGKGSASGVNPRVNLSYEPNPDLTYYAQVAKGFRPGAAFAPLPAKCGPQPTSYQPDDVWSYEVGEKARFFDRRLTLNASGYFENWQNIQQEIQLSYCGQNYSGNAGTAHVYGAEVEASLHLTQEIMLMTGLGYTDAKLSSVPETAILTGFYVGQRVQGVPEWADTSSLVYTHHINDDYNIVFRAADEYVGNQTMAVFTTYTVPAHNFVNMRLGLSSTKRVSAWLFANNVTNANTILNYGQPISVFVPFVNRAIVPQPRTIGVELNYAFGGR
jgi:iron complex outermembrane recepter protein